MSGCILAIDESYQCCAFLLPDKFHTSVGPSRSALPVHLVMMVSIPPRPQNSLRPDNDLYYVHGSYNLYTILPLRLPNMVSIPVLTFVFPNTIFGLMLAYSELPTLGLVQWFRVAALFPPALLPGLIFFFVTNPNSNMVLMM